VQTSAKSILSSTKRSSVILQRFYEIEVGDKRTEEKIQKNDQGSGTVERRNKEQRYEGGGVGQVVQEGIVIECEDKGR